MTLQEILRARCLCGGCKYQENYVYGENCRMCSSQLFKPIYPTDYRDKYELDESLKVIEEKAAKWDAIQWAIKEEIRFVWNGENRHVWLSEADLKCVEQRYMEREKDGNK